LRFKWILSLVVLVVVVVGAGAVYLAVIGGVDVPVLADAMRVDPQPPSPEVIARAERVEAEIEEAISDNSAFFLELTDEDLSALLEFELGSDDRIQNLEVEIRPEDVKISGQLAGRIGVGFSGVIGIVLDRGQVELDLKSVKLSALPTPGFVKDEIQPFIDEVLDINERLRESGATQIQAVNLSPGVIQIIGVQSAGATVSADTLNALAGASGGLNQPITPPGGSVVPVGRTGSASGSPVYLALGDSLAANVGANDPREGYVSRSHSYLENARGQTLGLVNLGNSGESTISILNGQLQDALDILNGSETVAVLTIDLGANDVLAHLGSADCTQGDQGPRAAACVARVNAALEAFSPNFRTILAELDAALPEDAEFYVMTVYNPFDLGIGIPFEDYTSSVVAQLNAAIRAEAEAVDAAIADPFDDMADNAGVWTNMLTDQDIHPNADGYQVLAYSLAQAREQAN
jgi:lysophospholipase L1-like esterase